MAQISESIRPKIDLDLSKVLQSSEPNQMLRVILIVSDPRTACEEPDLKPSAYATTADYRRALIKRRSDHLVQAHGETLQTLKDLSLEVHGGTLNRAVVVTGPVDQIRKALALPAIEQALLDHSIELSPSVSKTQDSPA